MTLAELIHRVIIEDGVSISAIARRANLRRSTVSSWARGTRAVVRPPDHARLRQLAVGLRRPQAMVFAAAGLPDPGYPADDVDELAVLGLYRELPEVDRRLALQILRALAYREPAGARYVTGSSTGLIMRGRQGRLKDQGGGASCVCLRVRPRLWLI